MNRDNPITRTVLLLFTCLQYEFIFALTATDAWNSTPGIDLTDCITTYV